MRYSERAKQRNQKVDLLTFYFAALLTQKKTYFCRSNDEMDGIKNVQLFDYVEYMSIITNLFLNFGHLVTNRFIS